MMREGNSGEGGRENDTDSSERDQLQRNECDLASDEFKKAWLTLKEVHDKQLHLLQAKIPSMREEQLADRSQADSAAKIKELEKQFEILNSTIRDLREQLSAKTCDRCEINEAYRNTLQKEMQNMQQLNLKFISGLNAEISKLREEIRKYSAKLKVGQQQFYVSFSDSDDDDFIPWTRKTKLVFDVRDPTQGTEVHGAIKSVKGKHTEQVKSGSKTVLEPSLKTPVPFQSNDIEVPEALSEKIPSDDGKPATKGSTCQKSLAGFPVVSTSDAQEEVEFSWVTNLPGDKIRPLKRKYETNATKKSSTQKSKKKTTILSLFSSPSEKIIPTLIVSQTSKENMPVNDGRSSLFLTRKKETSRLNVLPLDATSKSSEKERSTLGVPSNNNEISGKDGSTERLPSEQVVSETTKESTRVGRGVTKPPSDSLNVFRKPQPKRKANLWLKKK